MPTYIVNTAILRPAQDPKACAIGTPKMLMRAGVKDVKLRSCYCCGANGSVVFVLDAASSDSVLEAFRQINVPIASIMEAEEIKAAVSQPIPA